MIRDCGLFLVAIDTPGCWVRRMTYKQRIADYADALRATRPLDPANPVRVPFERSAAERARRLKDDRVEVPDSVVEGLRRVSSCTEKRS